MSIDKTLHADAEEIAAAIGKSKSTVERTANDENWLFVEGKGRGRNKKKWFVIGKLPPETAKAVRLARLNANLPTAIEPVATDTPAPAPVTRTALSREQAESQAAEVSSKQREVAHAVSLVMAFINGYPGSKSAAIQHLNAGYADHTLESPLLKALDSSRLKSSGKSTTGAVLSLSTVDKWQQRYKKTGSYLPQVRQKDMTIQPWHVALVELLSNNKGGRTYKWMHEQLVAQGFEVSEFQVYRWIEEKYSKMDVIKGRNSGMALRARQAYTPRSAEGLLPWEVLHADGWATHFSAPHPVTGEYVTFEVWDFHDVATRYVPPLSVGLSECFEVIAKGIELAIRDHGVMAMLQTDSTKIVKNNAKFTGDPVRSLSDLLGFTIYHPVTVGNAQANGIAENFHSWLDKECRVLGNYQGVGMDKNTFRTVGKLTAKMVKAAAKGETGRYAILKQEAEKIGGGPIFGSHQEAIAWLESIRQKWNNHPHSALKKIVDPVTGKLRNQTPQEALDEFKANGWEPHWVDEALLIDVFRPTIKTKVRRGMVKPYGKMLYRDGALDAYEGDEVIVSYDQMDYRQVWVKDLKGVLICLADYVEATPYVAQTALEAAQEKRGDARIRLKEKQIEQIKAQTGAGKSDVIEGECRQVIEFALPEPEPEKLSMDHLFMPKETPEPIKVVPVFEEKPDEAPRKLSAEETRMLLWGQQDDDEEERQEKQRI